MSAAPVLSACHVDGFGPLDVVRAESLEHLGEIVRGSTALYPLGGRTQLGLGNAPSVPGVAVDLTGLDDVVEFPARDMTITVKAGITVARLQALLAAEKLRLPVDVPLAERATLGGSIATNTSGPRRYGFGTLRDYVIGISAVNDEGREFKAGGRVVKNVAGYDLCKLLVGSLGTLGVITQATLKLRPVAEEQALFTLGCETVELEALLNQLHASRTRPVCIELLNETAAREVFRHVNVRPVEAPWLVVVGYEGNEDAVKWQVQQLIREVAATTRLEARVGYTAERLWSALVEWGLCPQAELTFKANLAPGGVATLCRALDGGADRPFLRAHAGSGIVVGQWPPGLTAERASRMLNEWRAAVSGYHGSVVVSRCPPGWKPALDVWGPQRSDAWLMRAVKDRFDPRGVFNPGRFVGGI